MSILIKIIGVSLITVFLSVILKKTHPEYSLAMTVCAASIIIVFLFDAFKTVFESVREIIALSGVESVYAELILKIMGIAYLSEYTAALFYDAGETAMGKKVELSGKLIILLVSLPVIKRLAELIMTIK